MVENGKKLEKCVAVPGPVINYKCDKARKDFLFLSSSSHSLTLASSGLHNSNFIF